MARGRADQSARIFAHGADRQRSNELRSDDHVRLSLPVIKIIEEHESPVMKALQRPFQFAFHSIDFVNGRTYIISFVTTKRVVE
jgi:hypothetical protein